MSTLRWTAEHDARFNQLRLRELSGVLSDTEQDELTQLMNWIESAEARQLADAVRRMKLEQSVMRSRLSAVQAENDELAKILSQLERLAADSRSWLAEFEQRHALIRHS